MSEFNPNKLNVEFREGVTATQPVIPRRYTLTHSDITAELFLTIGPEFAYDKINRTRDEVLGEWLQEGEGFIYQVYLHVDGMKMLTGLRNYVFRRELPMALEAIRYGDKEFFRVNPEFDYFPILVYFQSEDPRYDKVETWGDFNDYKTW
jgi:hypothetical protein